MRRKEDSQPFSAPSLCDYILDGFSLFVFSERQLGTESSPLIEYIHLHRHSRSFIAIPETSFKYDSFMIRTIKAKGKSMETIYSFKIKPLLCPIYLPVSIQSPDNSATQKQMERFPFKATSRLVLLLHEV